ncbi:MAG TPA: hypothetical protein VLK59_01060 [Solirubrobacteraceae bacterium]|nr:hypothetical protein [Solirubrobacteraceae bacterium]
MQFTAPVKLSTLANAMPPCHAFNRRRPNLLASLAAFGAGDRRARIDGMAQDRAPRRWAQETVGTLGASLALASAAGLAQVDLPPFIYGAALRSRVSGHRGRGATQDRQSASRNAFSFLYQADESLSSG